MREKTLEVGETVVMLVNSHPYQGEYQVRILGASESEIVVTMPTRQFGTIVPLAAGETVTVKYQGTSYCAQILNRTFGSRHTLTLTSPGALSIVGEHSNSGARFIAVTSGKGGVGKSTTSLNLALALVNAGLRVCMVDVDLGTANLDMMVGMAVSADLSDVLEHGKALDEVLVPVTDGLTLLPGSSGVSSVANLNGLQLSRLVASFNRLADDYDIVLLDTGAGVGENVTSFIQAADQVILVITPDPTAITDAYALLKVMKSKGDFPISCQLLVNRSIENEAELIQANFCRTALRHLGARVTFLGAIPESINVAMSVRKQQPFMLRSGSSEEKRAYQSLANKLVGIPPEKHGFMKKFQEVLVKLTS